MIKKDVYDSNSYILNNCGLFPEYNGLSDRLNIIEGALEGDFNKLFNGYNVTDFKEDDFVDVIKKMFAHEYFEYIEYDDIKITSTHSLYTENTMEELESNFYEGMEYMCYDCMKRFK